MRTPFPGHLAASVAGLVLLATGAAAPAEPSAPAPEALRPQADDPVVLQPGERVIAPTEDRRFAPPRVDEPAAAEAAPEASADKPGDRPAVEAESGRGGAGDADSGEGSPGAPDDPAAAAEAGAAGEDGAEAGDAPTGGSSRGETVYVGPPIETRPRVDEAAEQDEQGSAGEDEEGEEAGREEEMDALREELDGLRERLEQQPEADVSRIQQLEQRLGELELEAQLIEQARLERVAGYADLACRLEDVQRFLSDGEWQVLETVGWAEWLLGVYGAEATRLGALAELRDISLALQGLHTVRERLENEDLFYARFELTRVIVAVGRAREAAMLETGPASGALVDEPAPARAPGSGR